MKLAMIRLDAWLQQWGTPTDAEGDEGNGVRGGGGGGGGGGGRGGKGGGGAFGAAPPALSAPPTAPPPRLVCQVHDELILEVATCIWFCITLGQDDGQMMSRQDTAEGERREGGRRRMGV